jgi:hypothetical protein
MCGGCFCRGAALVWSGWVLAMGLFLGFAGFISGFARFKMVFPRFNSGFPGFVIFGEVVCFQ